MIATLQAWVRLCSILFSLHKGMGMVGKIEQRADLPSFRRAPATLLASWPRGRRPLRDGRNPIDNVALAGSMQVHPDD